MAVATSLSITICLPALARSTFVRSRAEKMHSDWINKFLVTVQNSAHQKRPNPSTLAFRVKGQQHLVSVWIITGGGGGE